MDRIRARPKLAEPVRRRTIVPPWPDRATPLAFDLRGTPAERRRAYRSLAELLAASPTGATAVIEQCAAAPSPRLVLRPGSVAIALLAEPSLRPLVRPAALAGAASGLPHSRVAALIPDPRRPDSRAPLAPTVDRAVPERVAGGSARLSVQTFWTRGPDRRLWVARWIRLDGRRAEAVRARFGAVATAAAAEWSRSLEVPVTYREVTWGRRAAWDRLAGGRLPRAAWHAPEEGSFERAGESETAQGSPAATTGHALVLGASGSGKTIHLADRAAEAVRRGRAVVVLDLHGDLSTAVSARLAPEERARIVGVDLAQPPFRGIAAIDPRAPTERAVAHVVAALKRLTPDGAELYWGFRLERILDAFVRLAHDGGGSLRDAYALLTDPERRDAARLATRSAELAQFLDELAPVVRRTPDFLWGAAARLAKVVTVPELGSLLAPPDGGLPVEELLADGRSLVVRLPIARLGPEAAAFAASLVLGRLYYGTAARSADGVAGPEILAVLDEVQAFSPRLVAEIYAEGRKFGWRLVAATQYPERLAPELRASAAADVDEIVAFRLAPPAAVESGAWVGLDAGTATRVLPGLAPGAGVAGRRELPEPRPVAPRPLPSDSGQDGWAAITAAARVGLEPAAFPPTSEEGDTVAERILLAVFAGREEGRPVGAGEIVDAVRRLPGVEPDAGAIDDRLGGLRRDRSVELRADGWALTPSGERRIGLTRPTGAVRESSEHRRLLLAAFRVFARRGYRLEIVRQGRFDLRLPDARLRQLPDRDRTDAPEALAAAVDRARCGWAWRYFGGRDVHVEAEVSGALRAERIRRGLEKARARGAAVLFVVADLRRAARIRAALRAERVGPGEARVWVLAPSDRATGDAPPGPIEVAALSDAVAAS